MTNTIKSMSVIDSLGVKEAAHPALADLLKAKELSDNKKYIQKNMLLRKLVEASPEDFEVSQDPDNGIMGISHRPTGFKIHTLVRNMPTNFLQSNEGVMQQKALKVAASVRLNYVMGY
jgi:hypothetical protein